MAAMSFSDSPLPKDGGQLSASQMVSLEQLLSLRQKTVVPNGTVVESVSANGAAHRHAHSLATESPLIWVVHGEKTADNRIAAKLQCLAAEANLEWIAMHAQVVEHAQGVQPYAVLIEFAPQILESASGLAKQLQLSHPHLPIVALGSMRDSQSMLVALRAGVHDFLDVEATDADIQQSFKELLEKGRREEIKQPTDRAPLVALVSARAGLGCSLLAAHIAIFLQQALQQRDSDSAQVDALLGALLLDLGAPAGDGALYLDLVSEFDFMDAVDSLRRFDQKMASAGLTQHASGLRLLSLPRQAKGGRNALPAAAEADLLVQRLGEYFQYIVADLGGASQVELTGLAATKANKILVVCDQSLPSVVSTTELLRQLEEQQVPRTNMELIVSRYDRSLELSAQHIAEQLKLPLLMTVPERRIPLLQAVNQGQLLSAQTKREPYVQAVQKIVDALLQSQSLGVAAKKSVFTSVLQRLRRG